MRTLRVRIALTAAVVMLFASSANAQFGRRVITHRRGPIGRVMRPVAGQRVVSQANGAYRNGYGTAVAGGRYIPGYGVTGGGFPGSYNTVGGTYAPGYGVMGQPRTPVVGGTYVPGYGVTGGAVGAQKVQGGTYVPGYGVR